MRKPKPGREKEEVRVLSRGKESSGGELGKKVQGLHDYEGKKLFS